MLIMTQTKSKTGWWRYTNMTTEKNFIQGSVLRTVWCFPFLTLFDFEDMCDIREGQVTILYCLHSASGIWNICGWWPVHQTPWDTDKLKAHKANYWLIVEHGVFPHTDFTWGFLSARLLYAAKQEPFVTIKAAGDGSSRGEGDVCKPARKQTPSRGGTGGIGRTFTTAQTRGAGADKRRAHPRGGGTAGDGGGRWRPRPSGPSRRNGTHRDRTALSAPRARARPRRARGRRGLRAAAGQAPGRGEERARPPPPPPSRRPPPPAPALPTRPPAAIPTCAGPAAPRPPPPHPRRGAAGRAGRCSDGGRPPASSGRRSPPAGAGSGPYLTGSAVMSPLTAARCGRPGRNRAQALEGDKAVIATIASSAAILSEGGWGRPASCRLPPSPAPIGSLPPPAIF